MHRGVVFANVVGELEQKRDRVLRGAGRAVSGNVANRHAARRGGCDVDDVHAGCEHTDAAQPGQRCQCLGAERRLVGEHDVGALRPLHDLFRLRALEDLELTLCGDLGPRVVAGVERERIEHDQPRHL